MAKTRQSRHRPRYSLRFGRGGLWYCLLTMLVLMVAVYVQANLLVWTFGLMFGGMTVSLIAGPLMLWGLDVRRILPEHGVAGQRMTLGYEIVSGSRWLPAFAVVVAEAWGRGPDDWHHVGPVADEPPRLAVPPQTWVMHLGPRRRMTAIAPCWPLRRGELRFEKLLVSVSFPFGVFQHVKQYDAPGQVLVYPHLFGVNRRMLSRIEQVHERGRHRVNRSGGQEEFYGLRDYRPEDSLKMIHWRRSARTGQWVSKLMSRSTPPKVMLLLDLSASGPLDADSEVLAERAIVMAASLICEAHRRGFRVGMAVRGAPCPPFPIQQGNAHRRQMLEALARLSLSLRMNDPSPPQAEPSVVIGIGGPSHGARRALMLDARDMQRYLVIPPGTPTPVGPDAPRSTENRQVA